MMTHWRTFRSPARYCLIVLGVEVLVNTGATVARVVEALDVVGGKDAGTSREESGANEVTALHPVGVRRTMSSARGLRIALRGDTVGELGQEL
jgi:hypothetical protein